MDYFQKALFLIKQHGNPYKARKALKRIKSSREMFYYKVKKEGMTLVYDNGWKLKKEGVVIYE